VVIFTTGEKTLSKSTPYSCRNPFATIRALYFGPEKSDTCLSRKTHLHGSAFRFRRSSTRSQVSFARMEFISDSIAGRQLAASVAFMASRYVVGSPAFVKNKPGEYLSDGCDSLSDPRGMTGLAGSSAIVLRTFELGSFDPVGLIVALLLGFSLGTAPSVLRGLADRETDLVCCAGPSKGVGTSENVTLHNLIRRSVALCIADSLKTTSELRTTWWVSGSHKR
jgi:hypothetical protein